MVRFYATVKHSLKKTTAAEHLVDLFTTNKLTQSQQKGHPSLRFRSLVGTSSFPHSGSWMPCQGAEHVVPVTCGCSMKDLQQY